MQRITLRIANTRIMKSGGNARETGIYKLDKNVKIAPVSGVS